jgi:hypothetical protein
MIKRQEEISSNPERSTSQKYRGFNPEMMEFSAFI